MDQNSADKGSELFVRFGVGELCSPAVIEFHKTRMGFVADDKLGISTGLLPIASLGLFAGRERMLVIIPFVLDKDFIGTYTGLFAGERVMEVFFLSDRDMVHSLFGCFFECSGDTVDPVAGSKFRHVSKGNN